jgi:hypothetical protein
MVLFLVHLAIKESSKTAVQAGEVEPVQLVMTQRLAGHAHYFLSL